MKWYEEKHQIEITVNYDELISYYRSNTSSTKDFYTTDSVFSCINGFIKVKPELYIKFSIGVKPKKMIATDLPKDSYQIEINRKNKHAVISVFPTQSFIELLTREDQLQLTAALRSQELYGVHYDLIVSSKPFRKTSNHKNVQELIARDLIEADRFSYGISPNTDSTRHKNEYFSGTGSNIGRRKSR